MHAMVLKKRGAALEWTDLADRQPGPGEIRVQVAACGVCRTDLHVVDGELPDPKLPIIPGHEIVGRIDAIGAGVEGLRAGERVGVPWLGYTCGVCPYCMGGQENLCDRPLFTGYTRDGGFATATIADARFAFPLGEVGSDVALAPLLCAGLIGWRSLVIAGDSKKLGLYGFGGAAHIVAQVAKWQGRSVFAFTRPGDVATQAFARNLGAGSWAVAFRIYVPLAMSGILVATILMFIKAFGDFPIYGVAGPLYPPSISYRMHATATLFQQWDQAAVLGVIIIVTALFVVWAYSRLGEFVGGSK